MLWDALGCFGMLWNALGCLIGMTAADGFDWMIAEEGSSGENGGRERMATPLQRVALPRHPPGLCRLLHLRRPTASVEGQPHRGLHHRQVRLFWVLFIHFLKKIFHGGIRAGMLLFPVEGGRGISCNRVLRCFQNTGIAFRTVLDFGENYSVSHSENLERILKES